MRSSLDVFDMPSPTSSVTGPTFCAPPTPASPASQLQQLRQQQQQRSMQPPQPLSPQALARLRELPVRFRALPLEVQHRILQLCQANPVVTVRGLRA